jgi:hypothetical protein
VNQLSEKIESKIQSNIGNALKEAVDKAIRQNDVDVTRELNQLEEVKSASILL